MSTSSVPLSALEGGNSAKFTSHGDKHVGRIVDMAERQQTEFGTNRPLTFADGSPRMQWVITLQKADGEVVALFAKGGNYKAKVGSGESMQTAISLAGRQAGAASIDVGGELAVAYTGDSEPASGMNPAKLYTATYRPPTAATKSIAVEQQAAPAAAPANLFDDA